MKKITIFIGSLLLSTAGFCGVGQFSGNTTCYVYKQGQLFKKLNCQYEGAEGAAMSYSFKQVTYKLPGLGVMDTSISADGFDRDGQPTGWTITVNNEPAIIRYRLPTNKRIVSDDYAASGKEVLECYLSKTSHWEICA